MNEARGGLEFSTPRKRFRGEFNSTPPIGQWDMLGPDRFLRVLEEAEDQRQARFEHVHPDRLIYIQSWASRLGGKDPSWLPLHRTLM